MRDATRYHPSTDADRLPLQPADPSHTTHIPVSPGRAEILKDTCQTADLFLSIATADTSSEAVHEDTVHWGDAPGPNGGTKITGGRSSEDPQLADEDNAHGTSKEADPSRPVGEDSNGTPTPLWLISPGEPTAQGLRGGETLPEGVTPSAIHEEILEVPARLVVSSRYRTRLPYPPGCAEILALQEAISGGRLGPLPARWIDQRFEVLGHELEHDLARAIRQDVVSIRVVAPMSEREAYLYDRDTAVRFVQERPFEKMRAVMAYQRFLDQGGTLGEVGAILQLDRTAVSEYTRYGRIITDQVISQAGIDERDSVSVERLRRLRRDDLRDISRGQTEVAVVQRLRAILDRPTPPRRKSSRTTRGPFRPTAPFVIPDPVDGVLAPVIDLSRMTDHLVDMVLAQLRERLREALPAPAAGGDS